MTNKHIFKPRQSNLELYRIIVMLLIVAHHYVVNSGVMNLMESDGFSSRSLFYHVFVMWGKIGINCFVLITGYFMCRSKITLRKFLKLFLEIEFYTIIIYLIFVITGYNDFSPLAFTKIVFWFILRPIHDSFIHCFLIFWLFIPFLNILINNLNRRQHRLLVILSIIIYTVIGSMPKVGITFNYVEWFIVLYFIASYLRNYQLRWLNGKYAGCLMVLSILLAVGSVVALRWLNVFKGMNYGAYFFVIDVNKVFALLVAVTSFSWFKDLKMPHVPLINTIGATTFGVFLIHTRTSIMRQWLWKDTIDVTGHYTFVHYILFSLIVVIVVFVICSLIDYLRIRLLENPLFHFLDKHFFVK